MRLRCRLPRGKALRRLIIWSGAGLVGLVLLLCAALLLLDRRFPFSEQAFAPPGAVIVTDRRGEPLRFFLPHDDRWRFPVRLRDVSPVLVETVLASEDRYFHYHPGVNPFSILRAALTNLRAGAVRCGGSTIPMQLARLADPAPRTLRVKTREALRALQLDVHYDKERLLSWYLNMAPFGGNIVGVGAAAYFYFGKHPSQLSLGEAALLAILPRSPKGYDPFRNPERAKAVRDRLLDQLARRGDVSRVEAEAAKAQELPRRRHAPPMLAPHLSGTLYERYARPANPRTMAVRSTLDARMQRIAQIKLRERVDWLRGQGLSNAAAVVLDVRTREVLVMVGSARFFDDKHQGQINGALTKRSPGSALKPFLYALAMDKGLVTPQSLLLDLPTDFAGYVAQNYDKRYRGRVTVEEALARSLNAPAVRLLAETGLGDFHALLLDLGLRSIDKPPGYYGLPLVLGGAEVRLLDLVNAYATLAQGGMHREVRDVLEVTDDYPFMGERTEDAPPGGAGHGRRLLSAEACHLVERILSGVERADMPLGWNLARDVPAVAWKTGTSYGHRDAWAVGYSSRHAVGVWVGNMDGRPERGISGARHAGPLLFELFRALEPSGSHLPEPEFLNIEQVEVCAESRHLATPLCTERMRMDIIPERSRVPRDTMHRRIFVDAETGELLQGNCLSQRPHKARVVREYPPELIAWQRSRGMAVETLPPLSPLCAEVPGGEKPVIVSPSGSTPYRIRAEAPREFQRIALVVQSPADNATLYWYQNGELVAKGGPEDKLFLPMQPGEHRLVVMDSKGRQDAVTFRVEEAKQ